MHPNLTPFIGMAESPLPIAHLSYTALMCFMRNKFEFKRTYIDKQYRDVNTPAIVVGKAFHKCMEMYYNGHLKEQAIEIGFHYIHDVEKKIDFGKTGSIEKVLEDYRQTVEHYFLDGEQFIKRELVRHTELSMKGNVDGIPVAIKAVADAVVVEADQLETFDIIDFKKVSVLSEPRVSEDENVKLSSSVKPEYMIQAAFNYWACSGHMKATPKRMHFLEVKTAKNREKGTPQCQLVTVDFTQQETLDYLEKVAGIIRSMAELLVRTDIHDHLFLPNVSDMFSGEESWEEWYATSKV